MELFSGERIESSSLEVRSISSVTDEEINEKYIKGDVRIVTEQARYPLSSIPSMVESGDYQLNPEFQRRHRWNSSKKSRLIESIIMNVPIPPIFLYEDVFSHYEVMDGLQRLTTISDFYKDKFPLEGLQEWSELNGRTYSQLPEQVRRGIDRRYLSSIILLQETAKDDSEAQRLKQLVFERINSGGAKLEPQEARNAIYNGPMNQLCIFLARDTHLCRTWNIPEPTSEEREHNIISDELSTNALYQDMGDVELVLRFFAYRQRILDQRGSLEIYLNHYLQQSNLFADTLLNSLSNLFTGTIELIYQIFDERAFWLWRTRKNGTWYWLERATVVVYDPMMYVFSGWLQQKDKILEKKEVFNERIKEFYETNYAVFEGRSVNRSDILERNRLFEEFVINIVG